MVTLYHFMRVWGIPDGSPFCVKVEAYLRMAGIEYKNDTSFNIQKAPKGKFPLIEHKGELIADSSLIIDYLKKEFSNPLDEHLNDEQIAQSLLVQRTLEEHIYWAVLYFRWVPDEAWQELKSVFFGHMPMPLKLFLPDIIRKDMIGQTKGHGLGRHSAEDIVKLAKQDVDAIATLLGDNTYFFNNKPSSIDAILYGFVANAIFCPIPNPIKDYVMTKQNVVDHCNRINKEYFSDMPSAKEPVAV